MKIAYVSRTYASQLHGGSTVISYLHDCLYKNLDFIHIEVPGTDRQDDGYPEINDLSAYSWLKEQSWGEYDVVLYSEYSFAPFFYMAGIDHAVFACHTTWLAQDGTSQIFEYFVPFMKKVFCSTAEVAALFRAKNVEYVRVLPYPVPERLFYPEEKTNDVVWVGRWDKGKNPEQAFRIAERITHISFKLFFPENHPELFKRSSPQNGGLYVGKYRDKCIQTIRASKVLLCTSLYESYSLVIIEGGLSGCQPLAPHGIVGISHSIPATDTFNSEEEAASKIEHYCKDGPKLSRDFWVSAYSGKSLLPRWEYELNQVRKK